MGRRARRPHLEGPAALAGALALAFAPAALAAFVQPAVAQAGWGRTLRLDGPQALDIIPARIGFSAGGEAAIAFGVQNADDPAVSNAFTALRSASGRIRRAQRIPRAREPLAVGYEGSRLALLTGDGGGKLACCASAELVLAGGAGRPRSRTTLVSGLTGDTEGRLVEVANGGLMAAIATQRGVWVAQSDVRGRFRAAHRLPSDGAPQTLSAAALPAGGAAIAWSTAIGGGENEPRRIELAFGASSHAPKSPHVAVTVPAGHSIDELSLMAGSPTPTLAWVESWTDSHGAYHSRVEVASASRGTHGRAVSSAGELASDITVAADGAGDQVVAWEGCDRGGSCVARVASRRSSHTAFGRTQRLGAVDASEAPAAALSPDGPALVGWVDNGSVFVASRPHGGRFGRPRAISRSGSDADLTIAFGPRQVALAAWTQGALAPSVSAAVYRGG